MCIHTYICAYIHALIKFQVIIFYLMISNSPNLDNLKLDNLANDIIITSSQTVLILAPKHLSLVNISYFILNVIVEVYVFIISVLDYYTDSGFPKPHLPLQPTHVVHIFTHIYIFFLKHFSFITNNDFIILCFRCTVVWFDILHHDPHQKIFFPLSAYNWLPLSISPSS